MSFQNIKIIALSYLTPGLRIEIHRLFRTSEMSFLSSEDFTFFKIKSIVNKF